jgi:hypothetical protein
MPANFTTSAGNINDFGVYVVNPGAMESTEKTSDIDRTALAGIQIKSFGARPYGSEFAVEGFYFEADHADLEADLQAMEALEKEVGTFDHADGEASVDDCELVLVTRGEREVVAAGVIGYYKCQFRPVR